ncbi:MAG TPA: IPT/TIG domain-containing protein [Propionicimonas sp.]|mgnify:CR=1 FL=1|nr:IPT/TIG domain-containing protein [Propionicimonas sp.]HQA78670.1 IPT/TIG domain-containing protein [Propionicimonas sp.]HQD97430.1 IPT/TIG domain-containing protein [Propionicimonas sp.]
MHPQLQRLAAVLLTVLLGLGLVPSTTDAAASAAPKVTKLSVKTGPTAGGTSVVIRGKNFTADAVVTFGSTPATSVRFVSSKKLVATTPASAAGRTDVRVQTASGRSKTGKRSRFTFIAPPAIASLSTTAGPVKGGKRITIKGSGFTKVSKVLFGGVKGKKLKVKSSKKLTVVVPARPNGYAEVKVVGRYGTSAGARYLYGTAPAAPPLVTGGTQQLAVASFNVTVATATTTPTATMRPWAERRSAVAGQLLREGIDVVGVQEASASARQVPTGVAQFQDLTNLMNELGGTYALTNTAEYCDGPAYAKCPNGAGQSDRIIFNTSRLALDRQGSRSLDDRTDRSGSARHVTWAQLTDRVTSRSFFFVSTHLEPLDAKDDDAEGIRRSEALRAGQASLILTEIAEENTARLPVVMVGDLATTKFTDLNDNEATNSAHQAFIDAGYADPLGNTYRLKSRNDSVFAQSLVNAQYSSLNDYLPAPKTLSGYEIGSYMDYILLSSRSITALEWKTVVDLDAAGNFSGVIPSDHNLVKLTVLLP